MLFVIFRSEQDAQIDKTRGEPWITHLRRYPVDETVLPHGAIVLERVEVSNPTYWAPVLEQGRGADGSLTVVRKTSVAHQRKVIEQRPGESGRAKDIVYVCEATEQDAKSLASVRRWTYLALQSKDQIPRKVAEPEQPETEKALPDAEGYKPENAGRVTIKLAVKALTAAGAPKINVDSHSRKELLQYIAINSGKYGDVTDPERTPPDSKPTSAKADSK